MTWRLGVILAMLLLLATVSAVEAHSSVDVARSPVADHAGNGPGDTLQSAGVVGLLILIAALGSALAASRLRIIRSRAPRIACLAAAVLLAAMMAQASPHLVHHVVDQDHGDSCKGKRFADLVVGLIAGVTVGAPSLLAVPLLIASSPDHPAASPLADRSRAPPAPR